MMGNTSLMEDVEKFMVNLENASAEELIVSVIVLWIVGAFMKNRKDKGGGNGGGISKMLGL